jgi:hypothetical protein
MSERYEQLSDFIRNKMRMAHIYQPVMLLELTGGPCRRNTPFTGNKRAHDINESYEKLCNVFDRFSSVAMASEARSEPPRLLLQVRPARERLCPTATYAGECGAARR